MRVSVFVGVSIDGFLARADGSFDFLTPFEHEPHGYAELMASVDTLVVGRATYDSVLAFPSWPYDGKRVVVLTHRPIEPRRGETTHAGTLAPLVARLAADGARHVYLDGGVAIRQGLDENLVDDLTVSTVPRLIGSGRPLFGGLPDRTSVWKTSSVKSFPSGLVQVRWER